MHLAYLYYIDLYLAYLFTNQYLKHTNGYVFQDIIKQTAVPFSIVISPMARYAEQEYAPPIVDFGQLGPVRCIRCKAYMCPFMQFIDSGRRFQCLFCKATTDGTLTLNIL